MTLSLLLFVTLAATPGQTPADEGLALLPAECHLSTPESTQRFLLQHKERGELAGQVGEGVEWSSSRPDVATVRGGVVTPVADGEALITARLGDREVSAKVVVEGMDGPFVWGFRNDVLPMFAKLGCNSGACHGALAGKGGFRLSLRGYDPAADFFQIVKQDGGRRIEFADPGRSLVLAKPSGGVRHKGGVRFETDSRAYRMLAGWIADGASPPCDNDPRVEQLIVWPARSLQRVGGHQQVGVQARYSDGRVEDVTRDVKWSSANEAVCTVDDDGMATATGPGEGAIVAWYASKIVLARITVPYATATPRLADDVHVDHRSPRSFIDEGIDKQLARLNLPASPACSDAEFLRRATVATIGRVPTADEARTFLADPSDKKRDALIDDLLTRPEFVDYWTYKWSDVLMLNGTLLRPQALKAYYTSVRKHVEANTPWDRFVREILTSTGDSIEKGETNFYALNPSPEEMTENACQAFLGLSLGCAKCHNHPLEKWTNDQYYAAANLFARVRAKGWGGEPRNGDGLRTLYVATTGELVQPRTGKPQPPTPLDGKPVQFDDPGDRRVHFADWLTSPDNPYFARAIANRVWANFLGVGLVESVDDMRDSNPASNDELLNSAAAFVVASKFDLKPLMKAILQSNAFQRSSVPLPENRAESRFYSRYYPRRMMAEVLHDAIAQVTEVPTKFEFIEFPGADKQKTDFYPEGTRAIQLYDSAVQNYFLQAFGRNPRRIVCECERSDQPTIVQVLHISNGDTINPKLRAPNNRVEKLLRLRHAGMSDAALIDEVYLTCLGRYPTEKERGPLVALLPAPGGSEERPVVEDIFWGIMSGREFLFNH
jgi:hypothetical protein